MEVASKGATPYPNLFFALHDSAAGAILTPAGVLRARTSAAGGPGRRRRIGCFHNRAGHIVAVAEGGNSGVLLSLGDSARRHFAGAGEEI